MLISAMQCPHPPPFAFTRLRVVTADVYLYLSSSRFPTHHLVSRSGSTLFQATAIYISSRQLSRVTSSRAKRAERGARLSPGSPGQASRPQGWGRLRDSFDSQGVNGFCYPYLPTSIVPAAKLATHVLAYVQDHLHISSPYPRSCQMVRTRASYGSKERGND
jgi:hypothetical protein